MNALTRFLNNLVYNGLESFGRYYSSYRAFVFSVDDPDNMSRLKLIIPQLSGNDFYEYWAYPKDNFSGKGYGSQVLPQVGDLVWVEFEGGHPEIPIWSHGHFGKDEKPTDQKLLNKNAYWFITPGGNKVYLLDTEKSIHLETTAGDYMEINPNSISLVTKKQISLGSLDKSAEPILLGNKTEDLFNTIEDYMETLHTALDLDIQTASPYIIPTKMKPKMPILKEKLEDIKKQIKLIKSTLTTTN